MAGLRVTISADLARHLIELHRHMVEANPDWNDPQADADYDAFSESVSRAIRKRNQEKRTQRVLSDARKALGKTEIISPRSET